MKDLQEQVEEQNNTIDNKDLQIVKLKFQLEEIKKIKKLEENPPSSCIPFGSSTGVHRIKALGIDSFDVLCDSQTAGDGWTVIQQRLDGKENFTRNWAAYRNGFGSFDGDFFLGLEKIHRLTSERRHILHIHMEHFNGTIHFVQYDHFNVSSVDEHYELNRLGQFSGNTTYNTLRMHINQKFTTYDRDNDISGNYNCADHNGGWWYTNCVHANLNGLFFNESVKNKRSMHWNDFDALRRVKMSIRPKID
ncbi:angiopoietin-related protein 7-like [Drosophila sulfurigaster albostrigata]|uniref:angiopoietin-related protein 7-like n=1 Tax=Drosophila sulfurigaster albostrigata TaxID=89887 RepID=UPI002D21BAB4|nr:angiopoietin-related protein 7-like [Drosophila sulfurigaster albostrigata]